MSGFWRVCRSINMRDEEVRRDKLIYDNPLAFVQVYTGELLSTHQSVAIKDQRFASLSAANCAITEAISQVRLSHPAVAQCYGLCMSQQTDGVTVSLVLELFAKDLRQEIEDRSTRNDFWSEEELWAVVLNLVEGLALAQVTGLSHRDIKPHNLFVDSQGRIKLGDFGSSKYTLSPVMDMHTLQGSPYFLSPALKQAFQLVCRGPSQGVSHNLFKSDVYSLGLTWLYMAKLAPSQQLVRVEELRENTEREISNLPYSEKLKRTIQLMLTFEEKQRPDFLMLQAYLKSGRSDLVTALNADLTADRLELLLATGKAICATIQITLKCRHCQSAYSLDVSQGCTSEASLLFCSQTCLNRYAVHPTPSKASPSVLCVNCEKRPADCSFLICKQCQDRQTRRLAVLQLHDCVVCSKPRSRVNQLFRRTALILPCGHRVCSQVCADLARSRCPGCTV